MDGFSYFDQDLNICEMAAHKIAWWSLAKLISEFARAWCLVLDVWCLVLDVWCLVLGVWCLVLGAKDDAFLSWYVQYCHVSWFLRNGLKQATCKSFCRIWVKWVMVRFDSVWQNIFSKSWFWVLRSSFEAVAAYLEITGIACHRLARVKAYIHFEFF